MALQTEYKTLLIERNDGVTTVRLNRPEKKNAMSPTLHREMHHALNELKFDDETRVLVITGNADTFCAGQDLKEYFYELKDDPRGREEIRRISHEWRHQMLYYFPKPTIAMINGWCFGGAFTIVASCDIAVAADEAVFGLSEINFGNIPGGLVTKIVQDLMLPRQALYYILTGDRFDGKRAVDIGFCTLSVPRAELEAKVAEIADKLKGKDAHALRACKEAFKAVTPWVHAEDAWYWLAAKVEELTFKQQGGWIEKGIGSFLAKEYKPGLGSAPSLKQES
jgi:trans-feruloyl-CoA hydratase/vanillin synthase